MTKLHECDVCGYETESTLVQVSGEDYVCDRCKRERDVKELEAMQTQFEQLVTELIPTIDDDYRATDDPDDDIPGMCLTVGYTVAHEETPASYGWQTGDNSFTGGAYCHPHWAVVYLYRDSDPTETAKDIVDQIAELIHS